jgi:hypothetical protein
MTALHVRPVRRRRGAADRSLALALALALELALAGAVAIGLVSITPRQAAAQQRATPARRATAIRTPDAALGMDVGADRTLANWPEIVRYFTELDAASPAVKVETLGETTERRPFIMATISTPANIARLDAIRRAQARLADPRGLSAAEEAAIVATQPTVLFISCNIHATEIGASQMAMELAHRLATNDTLQRALRNVVVLLVPSMNPDGQAMVTEWYRKNVGTQWEGGPLPWLYHHYVGHDNNRDWYMVTQRETRLVTDVLYRRWFPAVFYDVHQQGNEGMRLTVPPHVDPIDPNVDPIIVRAINHIGAEMSLALESAGKSGVGDGATYDLWWHGGARSAPTRHNIVGLLTEAASVRVATPITQDSSKLTGHPRGLPRYERRINFPNPWPGGTWRLRDIMDYELIAAEALVRMANEQRETYVRNFVRLGRKQVELGRTQAPYGWRIPKQQFDPGAAQQLVDVLAVGGVEAFDAGDAWVIPAAQPYRAHVKDLIEVQRFPKMEQYPGGPPQRPYDVAGWTLSMQMGVKVEELTQAPTLTANASRVAPHPLESWAPPGSAQLAPARDASPLARVTFTCERRSDDAVHGLWRFLRAEGKAALTPERYYVGGVGIERNADIPRGCTTGTAPIEVPASAQALTRAPRVGLYRPWTGNMDEGWTRWVLEQYGVPYVTLSDSVIKAGGLRDLYDAIIVPDMTLREAKEGQSSSRVPPAYAGGLGVAGLAQLQAFASEGGTLMLLDRASELATGAMGIGIQRITVPQRSDDDEEDDRGRDSARVRREPLYAPGSVLRVLVDRSHPLAAGMPDTAAVYFTNSTTFDVPTGSTARIVARYPARAEDILLSGYLQGAANIAGKAAMVEAPLGRGRVVLYGFRPQHRGQAVGTFKLLFNALLPTQ